MTWLSPLTTIDFHVPICNGHPSYISNMSIKKSLTPVRTSKGLSNSTNLSTGGEDNMVLSYPNTWWQGSSDFWDIHFLYNLDKVRQPLSLMLSYAIVIHLGSASPKMLVKTQELDHMWQRKLAPELPKGLGTRLISLLGESFF